MITKSIVIGLLSILESGQLQLREDTVIDEDGIELSRTYHRKVLEPGDDVSTEPPLVQAIAAIVWTTEVIEKRKAELNKIRESVMSASS
jgi:hypothetical protein